MVQIGIGEPIGEEIQKIKSFPQRVSELAKNKKNNLILATLIVLLVMLVGVLEILPKKFAPPIPPQPKITPTPISFTTPTPTGVTLRPLSQEGVDLSKQLDDLILNDPSLNFPNLNWQISVGPL